MKCFKLMIVAISCLIFVGSAYAAPVIKIIPENGATQVVANPGDELQFQVHLFNDSQDNLRMGLYGFSLWLDPNELQFVSYSYGPEPQGFTAHNFPEGSWTEPRNDKDTNYEPWWGSFDSHSPVYTVAELEGGGDWNLGTLTAQVLNPVADGDWDVEIKYWDPMGEYFFVNDWSYSPDTRYQQVVGTDVVPTGAAVPIPATVWLLSSGLVGLIGIRRKMA